MGLKVDAIVSPVLFEEEDTGLVELAIAPEDENKYPFVHPRSDPGTTRTDWGERSHNGRMWIWILMSGFRLTLHIEPI